MSDTPRVDQVHWNHAYLKEEAYKLERELNAAQQRIKRLEEAGDAMAPMNDTECECDDRSVLICKYCFDSSTRWFKAKEAKPCIKQLKTKSCIYCMKVECECSDFDVSADMGSKG